MLTWAKEAVRWLSNHWLEGSPLEGAVPPTPSCGPLWGKMEQPNTVLGRFQSQYHTASL